LESEPLYHDIGPDANLLPLPARSYTQSHHKASGSVKKDDRKWPQKTAKSKPKVFLSLV